MNNLFLLKLNRAVWIALIEQEKIVEAISYFESYYNNLEMLQSDKDLKDKINMEMTFSRDIFLSKMTRLAEEYLKDYDYSDAAICYTAIFKYEQRNINNIRNYIKCLDALNQYDLEVELVQYLKALDLENEDLYKLLSEIYEKQNDVPSTIKCYEKYLELKGVNKIRANEYNQLGCYYNLLYTNVTNKYEDIIKSLNNFEKASDLEPYVRLFHKNATIMASKANDWATCRKHWDKLLEINEMTNDDKYDYAAFCLKTKDFEQWHKYFDSRFQKENNRTQYPNMPKPKWNGVKDISKSTLLVHYEQGFGDTFLMWGYMPRLKQLAKHVIFVVQDCIYDLLKDNDWGIEVIPKSLANLETLKFDYHIPSMSIPVVLKLSGEELSVGEGFIKPDENLVKTFKEKYFNNNKFKIGISFSGSVTGNKTRDIALEQLLPLDNLQNVEIYSFTKGIDDKEFECFKNNKVINIAKDFNNFADTAAAIANIDVMLTSDNCILNLAGAIGIKTFALFNWHYEFRWFDLSGDNTIWLTSVKPFVNDEINNWSYSVNNAIKAIEDLRK